MVASVAHSGEDVLADIEDHLRAAIVREEHVGAARDVRVNWRDHVRNVVKPVLHEEGVANEWVERWRGEDVGWGGRGTDARGQERREQDATCAAIDRC